MRSDLGKTGPNDQVQRDAEGGPLERPVWRLRPKREGLSMQAVWDKDRQMLTLPEHGIPRPEWERRFCDEVKMATKTGDEVAAAELESWPEADDDWLTVTLCLWWKSEKTVERRKWTEAELRLLRDYFAAKALPGVLYMVAHGVHDAASSAEG